MRWLTLIGSVIFYACWFGYVFIYSIRPSNALANLTESIVLMLVSGFVLITLGIKTEFPVLKNYRFWFACTVFIYFSVNILLDYIFELIAEEYPAFDMSIWNIHTVLNIGVYFLFGYAFYLPEI